MLSTGFEKNPAGASSRASNVVDLLSIIAVDMITVERLAAALQLLNEDWGIPCGESGNTHRMHDHTRSWMNLAASDY
jgi:hypothetical protein